MNRTINILVDGSHLTKDRGTAGVQHEGNSTVLRIKFDESWDNLAKSVTWWNAKGLNPVVRVLTVDMLEDIQTDARIYRCPIPAEPLTEAGMCTFVIDGFLDGKRQRSISDQLKVTAAPYAANAGAAADPTPTQAEQLQTQMEAVVASIRRAIEVADIADNARQTAIAAQEAAIGAVTAAGTAAQAATNAASVAEAASAEAQRIMDAKHASRHSAGGVDAITPDMIGAARGADAVISGSLTVVGNAGALNLIGSDHVYMPFYKNGLGTQRSGYIGYGDGNAINMTISNEAGGSLDLRSAAGLMINGYQAIHEGLITKSTHDIGEGVAMAPGSWYAVYE